MATSYQCGTAHVDSTGQSPGALTGPVSSGNPLGLQFGAGTQPESVEVRIYPGSGVSASFFRWPEELPTGIAPVVRLEGVAGPEFEIVPQLPQGEYSMVIHAAWAGGVEAFYALGFSVE